MFASPYLRRRAAALAVIVCAVALALLALPGSSSGARPAHQHVVLPGETLWGIASATYGGDAASHVEDIARASHLQSALIVPGQRLVLP
jgi:LysM repeat protein